MKTFSLQALLTACDGLKAFLKRAWGRARLIIASTVSGWRRFIGRWDYFQRKTSNAERLDRLRHPEKYRCK